MAYRVELTDRASRDLETIYRTIAAATAAQAQAWFDELMRLVQSLDERPLRGAAIPEGGHFRHLLHGRKPHVYRVIYEIDERDRVVTVLHIRHGRREAFPLPGEGG